LLTGQTKKNIKESNSKLYTLPYYHMVGADDDDNSNINNNTIVYIVL